MSSSSETKSRESLGVSGDSPPCDLSSFLGVADGVGGWTAFGVDSRRFASELMGRAAAASSAFAADIRESRMQRLREKQKTQDADEAAEALKRATRAWQASHYASVSNSKTGDKNKNNKTGSDDNENDSADDSQLEAAEEGRRHLSLLEGLAYQRDYLFRQAGEAHSLAEEAEKRLPYGGAAAVARSVLRKAFERTLACGASTALVVYCDSRAREAGVANVGDCSVLLLR